jgi:hypothetical protein
MPFGCFLSDSLPEVSERLMESRRLGCPESEVLLGMFGAGMREGPEGSGTPGHPSRAAARSSGLPSRTRRLRAHPACPSCAATKSQQVLPEERASPRNGSGLMRV